MYKIVRKKVVQETINRLIIWPMLEIFGGKALEVFYLSKNNNNDDDDEKKKQPKQISKTCKLSINKLS